MKGVLENTVYPHLQWYKNPVFLVAVSISYALIYLVIPSTNYWINSLVRISLFWQFATAVFVIELYECCLPGMPNNLYFCVYFVGALITPFLNIIFYALNLENNFYFVIFSEGTSVYSSLIIYGFYAWFHHSQLSVKVCAFDDVFAASHGLCSIKQTTSSSASSKSIHVSTMSQIDTENLRPSHRLQVLLLNENPLSDSVIRAHSEACLPSYQYEDDDIGNTLLRMTWASRRSMILPDESIKEARKCGRESEQLTSSCLLNCTPRGLFLRSGLPLGVIVRDAKLQWLYSVSFVAMILIFYYFVFFFTVYFRTYANDDTTKLLSFWIYLVVCSLLRLLVKRLGLEVDNGKISTTSLFFLGEVYSLLFYFVFYRVLFLTVRTWGAFFLLQVSHLASDWVLYPLRCSELVYAWCERLSESRWKGLRNLLMREGLDLFDWQQFVCLDFSLRCTVMLSTGVGMLVLLVGVNNIPWVHSSLEQTPSEFANSAELISISVILEIINATAINALFFAPRELDVRRSLMGCFSDVRFAVMFASLTAVLLTNPIDAFTIT